MRLLTHNMLKCNVKGVKNGYPLNIDAKEVAVEETDFNEEFVQRMIPKLEWGAFLQAASQLAGQTKLPELPSEVTDELMADTEFLKAVHHVLLEVKVVEGGLVCPESGRVFPITKGIPNMLLQEDEV